MGSNDLDFRVHIDEYKRNDDRNLWNIDIRNQESVYLTVPCSMCGLNMGPGRRDQLIYGYQSHVDGSPIWATARKPHHYRLEKRDLEWLFDEVQLWKRYDTFFACSLKCAKSYAGGIGLKLENKNHSEIEPKKGSIQKERENKQNNNSEECIPKSTGSSEENENNTKTVVTENTKEEDAPTVQKEENLKTETKCSAREKLGDSRVESTKENSTPSSETKSKSSKRKGTKARKGSDGLNDGDNNNGASSSSNNTSSNIEIGRCPESSCLNNYSSGCVHKRCRTCCGKLNPKGVECDGHAKPKSKPKKKKKAKSKSQSESSSKIDQESPGTKILRKKRMHLLYRT